MENLEIYMVNGLAIILTLIMAYVVKNKLYMPADEKKDVTGLSIFLVCACIIEPFTFVLNKRSGSFNCFFAKFLNSFMYISYIIISYHWFLFLHKHMLGQFKKKAKFYSTLPIFVVLIMVVINLFVPCIFYLDDNNNYVRMWGYYICLDMNVLYIIASLGHYFVAVKKNGGTNLFPVLLIIIPAFAGIMISTFLPQISVILGCISIGLAGVITSLQNETIYRDHLTGIYNRAYIDVLTKRYRKKKFVGIMIDLNDFKKINDTFWHKEGDNALINFANVLSYSVGVNGTCIRYAGDEFIIFLAKDDIQQAEIFLNGISVALSEFKIEHNIPYELTFSYGLAVYDPHEISFNEFLNQIDSKMYTNKRKFYAEGK